MIENTRIFEIFEKVIFEFRHSGRPALPGKPDSYAWSKATEELFFKSNADNFLQSFFTGIHPDARSSRRKAYRRLFGMELNHRPANPAAEHPREPMTSGREFVSPFEAFLSEVWAAIAGESMPNAEMPGDASTLDDLIRRLRELLTGRRQTGNFDREEFCHAATMSWMHLTLYVDKAPIVEDLNADAPAPAERLRLIGKKVGIPAHPKSDSFFKMAEPISDILGCIENVPNLNSADFIGRNAPLRLQTETVINHWFNATGRGRPLRGI